VAGREADAGDFDEDGGEAGADHLGEERVLGPLPEVGERREAEAAASGVAGVGAKRAGGQGVRGGSHMLHADSLIVGQDGADRDASDVGVVFLRAIYAVSLVSRV
jgi:hypothetical protein